MSYVDQRSTIKICAKVKFSILVEKFSAPSELGPILARRFLTCFFLTTFDLLVGIVGSFGGSNRYAGHTRV